MSLENLKDRAFWHLSKFEDVKGKMHSVRDVGVSRDLSLELEQHFNEAKSHLLEVNAEILRRNEENDHVIRQVLGLEKEYENCRNMLKRVSLTGEQGSFQTSQEGQFVDYSPGRVGNTSETSQEKQLM